jgi:hypothetical protein
MLATQRRVDGAAKLYSTMLIDEFVEIRSLAALDLANCSANGRVL